MNPFRLTKERERISIDPFQRLKQLHDSLTEIGKQFSGLIDLALTISSEHETCLGRVRETWDPRDLRAAIDARAKSGVAHEIAASLRIMGARDRVVQKRWIAQNSDWRETLVRCAEHRAKTADENYHRALAATTRRLRPHNFDQEQIEGSPEVRRARSQREQFARILERVKSEPDETAWQFASDLADHT